MTRRKRYSAEFKREALRRANEEGVTDVLVAEELGIDARQLRRWRESKKQHGDNAFPRDLLGFCHIEIMSRPMSASKAAVHQPITRRSGFGGIADL